MATTIKLSWAANPAAEGVLKYRVFESVDGGPFVFKADVPASPTPELTILNPAPGVYRWQHQAVNFVGDSIMGNIALGPDVPTQPGDITVTITNS